MRKRNGTCIAQVMCETQWHHKSSCANSIFTRTIRYGFESSMNCIFRFVPFLSSDTWIFPAHNKIKFEFFLLILSFSLLFVVSIDFRSALFCYFSFHSIEDMYVCVFAFMSSSQYNHIVCLLCLFDSLFCVYLLTS